MCSCFAHFVAISTSVEKTNTSEGEGHTSNLKAVELSLGICEMSYVHAQVIVFDSQCFQFPFKLSIQY